MDVDASDNIFIYVGFTTGQLDLDPGPLTTLVNPGKVYAKYNANGQFQWGFSVENATDMSEDYGGISCDDAGNLYITGDLRRGHLRHGPRTWCVDHRGGRLQHRLVHRALPCRWQPALGQRAQLVQRLQQQP